MTTAEKDIKSKLGLIRLAKLLIAPLQAGGYKNIRRYPGGIEDWIEAGYPIEGSTSTYVFGTAEYDLTAPTTLWRANGRSRVMGLRRRRTAGALAAIVVVIRKNSH